MSDKISLDPRSLKLADLKRAKAGPLEGRNPVELFDDPLESATLVVWCIRSRDDPEFTWADAEQAELGDFAQFNDDDAGAEQRPSPSGSPGEPNATPTGDERPPSSSKPPRRGPNSSSGSSSGSPEPSTTT